MFKRFVTIIMIISILCSVVSSGITATAYYEAEIIYGDVDGSGIVDTEDARLALQLASGVAVFEDDVQLKRTDINFDGVVTIFDARQILRGIAGLATLQPSGAITGFDGGGIFGNEATLVAYFNAYLNKIKVTESEENQYIDPDITKTTTDYLTKLNIKEMEIPSFGFGISAESIASMVEEALTEDDSENEITEIYSGDDFSFVSVEGENYVSNLSASDVFGSRASYDEELDQVTIEIALPDTEIEMTAQSAYSKVLNASQLIAEQDTVLMSLIKGSTEETSMLREFKNCVLKLVVDRATANVISYTISYQSKVYVAKVDFTIGSFNMAALKGIEFEKEHLIKYENFNWDA